MAADARHSTEPAAPHGDARFAGLIYAIVVATGFFSLAYAPTRIFAGEAEAEIARSVVANQNLLRVSIAAELTCYVAFLVLALALYKLLARTGQFAAMLMAALAVSSVPFGFANVTHLLEIVGAIDGDATEAARSIAAARERYRIGLFVQSIPWGLWLIPFGYLVFRSGILPRILGGLLILAGLGYVGNFLGRLVFEEAYAASGLAPIFDAPQVSEILICAWLLVFGARRSPLPKRRKA